jgi:metallo-beta-lactamase family protein
MAVDATRIYSDHIRDSSLDESLVDDGRSGLFPRNVQFDRSVDEPKTLNRLPGPRIVISSIWMLTAVRVLHHLKRLLPDERNLVVLVGNQAVGTRGRAIMNGVNTVRVHGQDVPVKAQFIPISRLSSHGDRNDLLRWVRSEETAPKSIFITHDGPKSSKAFTQLLREEIGRRTFIPKLLDGFDLADLPEWATPICARPPWWRTPSLSSQQHVVLASESSSLLNTKMFSSSKKKRRRFIRRRSMSIVWTSLNTTPP